MRQEVFGNFSRTCTVVLSMSDYHIFGRIAMRARHIAQRTLALIALVALVLVSPGLSGNGGAAGVAWAQPEIAPQGADPPDRVGRLNYLNGPVSYAPGGVNQWANA